MEGGRPIEAEAESDPQSQTEAGRRQYSRRRPHRGQSVSTTPHSALLTRCSRSLSHIDVLGVIVVYVILCSLSFRRSTSALPMLPVAALLLPRQQRALLTARQSKLPRLVKTPRPRLLTLPLPQLLPPAAPLSLLQ